MENNRILFYKDGQPIYWMHPVLCKNEKCFVYDLTMDYERNKALIHIKNVYNTCYIAMSDELEFLDYDSYNIFDDNKVESLFGNMTYATTTK